MKKLTYLFLALTIVACSSDDEGNPCVYNPTLTTSAVTNVTETSATLNGVISIVSENCDNPTNTEQGFVYATTIQPTTANNKVNVNGTDISTTLENLEPNTNYYVRTFLTNALGEFYGNEVSFTTSEEQLCVYNLNTQDVTEIITTSAVLIGTIITEDIENCELPNTEQGFVYSTEVQPTIEDTQVNINGTEVTTTLENLEPSTTYYVRTFLTNELGEFYGNEVSFVTSCDVVYLAENGITIKAYECAEVGDTGVIDGVTYTVVDEAMLRAMIANEEDVTKMCTTRVTDMNDLFLCYEDVNQPIGHWDVGNVIDMSGMFYSECAASNFNQDISHWDVSNVINMNYMFGSSSSSGAGGGAFNQPIGDWDVSNVTNMNSMFRLANFFNQNLSTWNVNNVTFCIDFSDDASSWSLPQPNFTNCTP